MRQFASIGDYVGLFSPACFVFQVLKPTQSCKPFSSLGIILYNAL